MCIYICTHISSVVNGVFTWHWPGYLAAGRRLGSGAQTVNLSGFRVWGFRVWGLGFRVEGLGAEARLQTLESKDSELKALRHKASSRSFNL